MANTDILVAKESFSTTIDGENITVHKGVTRVRAGHKLAKRYAAYFEPLTVHYDIEQATSAPAEQRGAPKPAAKPAVDPEAKAAAEAAAAAVDAKAAEAKAAEKAD